MNTTTIAAAMTAAALALSPIPVALAQPLSCATADNRVCLVDNASGLPAGCYSDTGAMVAPMPCYVVVNRDGTADVYRP